MFRRLALNSASNVGTLVLKLGITFIMTPLLIRNLGRYDYGIWEMLGATLGYMGMLDLSIRPTVSRFASRYLARKDAKSLGEVYSSAWFYLAAVGMALALGLAAWGVFFPGSLAEHPGPAARYTALLVILACQLLVVFPAYAAESFMEAYQDYYLKNLVTVINSLIGCAIIWLYITPGNALVLLAGVNAGGLSLKYAWFTLYIYRKNPLLRPRLGAFSRARLGEMFRFGIKSLVQGVFTRMEYATDSLVIGSVLGPAVVPFYSVPANLVFYIRGIVLNVTHAFMPYFSSLHAVDDRHRTLEVYVFVSKITVGIVCIFTVGALGLGKAFLTLWVGAEIATQAAPIIVILVGFTVLPLLNPLDSRYLTAVNRHGVFARWLPVTALANLGLSLVLIHPLGIKGVALGSLIPALLFRPYLLRFCCRELGIGVRTFMRLVWLPLLAPTAAMALVMLVLTANLALDSFAVLLAVAVTTTGVFLAVGWFTVLRAGERRQLVRMAAWNSPA